MPADPKNKNVRIKVANKGFLIMKSGLAEWLGFQVLTSFPAPPSGMNKKIGGIRNRAKAAGKIARLVTKEHGTYTIRYTCTFREAYEHLRAVSDFESKVKEFRTLRMGSRASSEDGAIGGDIG